MPPTKKKPKDYCGEPFWLDDSDLSTAVSMGLLRPEAPVQHSDPSQDDYDIAYDRRDNVGSEYHGTQKAIQTRCNAFARASGFQLKVESYSSKRNGVGNAKYVCKKLNGQQFFYKEANAEEIVCPFSINVSGIEGFWKVTRVNFAHNHIKNVGFSSRPVAEGTIPRPAKDKRNATQSIAELTRLAESEMLPLYEGKTEKITGAAISDFFVSKGFTVGASAISRIKRVLDEANSIARRVSYHKLESYLKLMAEKTQVPCGSLRKKGMEHSSERVLVSRCWG
ncbi:hypothetical protein PF008_g5145 [Phytophthora fragariae]|uniref:Uncharacterized protein n=1 Tax=Phytophthora fragariae TaxID=53985 RepID=A0A6G0S971_9STRA|nr:hypothetical protein PF008_g5145 [Phytophthora fragariae]